MEFETFPKAVLERAAELVGLSGETLDPETAVLLALREEDRLPVPRPGLHDDLLVGAYGEALLRTPLDAARRDWEADAGSGPLRLRFDGPVPPWAGPGVTVRFIGAERNTRDPASLRLPPDALVVPAPVKAILDPTRLVAGIDDVTVEGPLLGLDPTRTFNRKDGLRGFIARARVGTDAGIVEVTLWDDAIRPLVGLPVGARVRLTGLYTKEREGRVEVNSGRSTMVQRVEDG